MMRPTLLCSIAISILAFPVLAGESLYVSPAGDDEAAGTRDAPFRTISHAVRAASPGDTVVVLAGAYPGPVQIAVSGEEELPITVRAEEGEVVQLFGTDVARHVVNISGNHLIFEGFELKDSGWVGILVWGTQDVTVRNNRVTGSVGPGIWVGEESFGLSRNNVIEGNTVVGNAQINAWRDMERRWPGALEISASDDTIVRGNFVYGNYGEGIGVLSSRGVLVDNNYAFDNYSVNIYLDNAPGATVTGNFVGTTGNTAFFREGHPPHGIAVDDAEAPLPLPTEDVVITGNTLVGVEDVVLGDDFAADASLRSIVTWPNAVRRHELINAPELLGN